MLGEWKETVRMFPMRKARSFGSHLFHYAILLSLSFVFVYPMLYIVSQSLMQVNDIADATVQWIPKELNFEHFRFAFDRLHFWRSFMNSTVTSLGAALLQIISCAIVGYGFARYRFPGYNVLLGLVLFTFLVPPQTIVVPLYMFFSDLGWINTYLPFLVPSAFGHGLRGALFVLIFIQFFRGLPYQLEESARIDGAGAFRTFRSIMLPLAGPAMLVVFLFSVVWHWNDVFEPNLYFMVSEHYNLPQSLMILNAQAEQQLSEAQKMMGGAMLTSVPTGYNRNMAGALLTILPLVILYGYAQRYFVESLERTGIAGE
ncbi:carbohydrate ABC transporter permease [Cohnella pontilimi]|uniref:Carbohydrate ABC transporter permease n=1 Tax=Cohnella pontilimi TaxID=2564100 RepID=A0A4U0FD40_9BACL|nr:carbohydrate ABC transporter permease [Cohnella pontilimi]TJY42164.1 carbohydrate ABC transporter permease [Cohnella pontilimi]